jgi:predicted amidophosphoribosyltransferase
MPLCKACKGESERIKEPEPIVCDRCGDTLKCGPSVLIRPMKEPDPEARFTLLSTHKPTDKKWWQFWK